MGASERERARHASGAGPSAPVLDRAASSSAWFLQHARNMGDRASTGSLMNGVGLRLSIHLSHAEMASLATAFGISVSRKKATGSAEVALDGALGDRIDMAIAAVGRGLVAVLHISDNYGTRCGPDRIETSSQTWIVYASTKHRLVSELGPLRLEPTAMALTGLERPEDGLAGAPADQACAALRVATIAATLALPSGYGTDAAAALERLPPPDKHHIRGVKLDEAFREWTDLHPDEAAAVTLGDLMGKVSLWERGLHLEAPLHQTYAEDKVLLEMITNLHLATPVDAVFSAAFDGAPFAALMVLYRRLMCQTVEAAQNPGVEHPGGLTPDNVDALKRLRPAIGLWHAWQHGLVVTFKVFSPEIEEALKTFRLTPGRVEFAMSCGDVRRSARELFSVVTAILLYFREEYSRQNGDGPIDPLEFDAFVHSSAHPPAVQRLASLVYAESVCRGLHASMRCFDALAALEMLTLLAELSAAGGGDK